MARKFIKLKVNPIWDRPVIKVGNIERFGGDKVRFELVVSNAEGGDGHPQNLIISFDQSDAGTIARYIHEWLDMKAKADAYTRSQLTRTA